MKLLYITFVFLENSLLVVKKLHAQEEKHLTDFLNVIDRQEVILIQLKFNLALKLVLRQH